jgi:serine/threonine-protein kinase HSL1 (negative regulator of Swe1 kinase)
MLAQNNNSFAGHAARTALAPIRNAQNVPLPSQEADKQNKLPSNQLSQPSEQMTDQTTSEIDRIVVSVENATKRLSQISTNTNSSKRKSKNHVGPWRLGRTLGRGSTGRVRLAKHSETGQLAAVKIVPKSKFQKDGKPSEKSASPYGIEREIIIMKLISHQNIMGLYDVWENKGELYLVLEYVEGGELFDYLIKKGKLPEREAVHYFRQIISGVSYCHRFNICHRDLKPENLLLDKNNNIKIADFGMAALEINQKLLETSCGSPHYASPEIVTGKTYHGSPSDIWSCGIVLFALLTGHLPFDDENIRNLLLKVRSGRFITPNYLSAQAKDLIWKMLKVNPDERIKVNDIFTHPLLKKYETAVLLKSKMNDQEKVNSYHNEVDHFVLKREDIDRDILKSLSILFHGANENALISKLLDAKANPERIFYYLLLNYKKQHQSEQKNDGSLKKRKSPSGDTLLKRSKSTVKTTITNEDGSTEIKLATVELPPLPTTPKKKVVKSSTGQLQISASNSYRRGVSFNNKQGQISRSSSKRSIVSNSNNAPSVAAMKKRQSLLPPLPDLDVDWLKFDTDGLPAGEFAALYEEIFNYNPKSSPKTFSKKILGKSFVISSPLQVKKVPTEQHIAGAVKEEPAVRDIPVASAKRTNSFIVNKEEEKENVQPSQSLPPAMKAPLAPLPDYDFNRRSVTEPVAHSKQKTLDPIYKTKAFGGNTGDVLQRLGVSLKREQKTRSKIYYSKSSTSINLAAILKSDAVKTQLTSNLAPPVPKHRISSSNYASSQSTASAEDEDVSSYDAATIDMTFDFEVPMETEVATAVPISNGSNVTVGNKLKPREDSMFIDAAISQQSLLKLSNSDESIIKHHRKASSNHGRVYSPMLDIRGSLYNNPSDLKDDAPVPRIEGFERPRFSHLGEEDFDESKTTIMDNSMFADNTDDDLELEGAKRVTMIFDEFDDNISGGSKANTPTKDALATSPSHKPLIQSPLGCIQEKHFKTSTSSAHLRQNLQPQRDAPAAPEKNQGEPPKKINWLTKFFTSLLSSESPEKKKLRNVKVFTTSVPLPRMRKAIKLVLELKRKEGTLTTIKETSSLISATIPPTFALGKPLKFEIKFDAATNTISLEKIKGSKKIFKNLISAMEYVVDVESLRYYEGQE